VLSVCVKLFLDLVLEPSDPFTIGAAGAH